MDGRLLDDEPVLVETAVFARTLGRILHVLEASHLPLELSCQRDATSRSASLVMFSLFLFCKRPQGS